MKKNLGGEEKVMLKMMSIFLNNISQQSIAQGTITSSERRETGIGSTCNPAGGVIRQDCLLIMPVTKLP